MKFLYALICFLALSKNVCAQSISISAADTTICLGVPVTFSAVSLSTGTPHFQWQVNNIPAGADSSGFTTSDLTDDDSVRCIMYNATFDTVLAISDTIVMQVHSSAPDAGALSGPDKVCVGATVSLTATVAGGTWSTANGHASVTGGIVKGESSGFFECPYDVMDTVLYIIANSCGVDTAMYKIVVLALPSVTVDLVFADVCPFPGFVFTGPKCFGDYYIVPTFKGRDFTEGWLYGVAANECGSDTGRYYQKVRYYTFVTDTPNIITATTDVCVGSSILLSADDDYYGHHWRFTNRNAVLLDSAGGYYMAPQKPGLDTILLSYRNFCSNGTSYAKYDTLIINIHAQPHIDSVTERICADAKTQLHATPPGGLWSSGNTAVVTVEPQTGQIRAVEKGAAHITYTTDGPCSATANMLVEDCPADAWISPTPVGNQLTIHLLNDELYTQCVISNTAGQVMQQQPLTGTAVSINTSWYAAGVYFVRLTGPSKEKTISFLKQ